MAGVFFPYFASQHCVQHTGNGMSTTIGTEVASDKIFVCAQLFDATPHCPWPFPCVLGGMEGGSRIKITHKSSILKKGYHQPWRAATLTCSNIWLKLCVPKLSAPFCRFREMPLSQFQLETLKNRATIIQIQKANHKKPGSKAFERFPSCTATGDATTKSVMWQGLTAILVFFFRRFLTSCPYIRLGQETQKEQLPNGKMWLQMLTGGWWRRMRPQKFCTK